ncbi:MAG TPA: flagellar basal body P-ring formation chaperone FlgA [Caulobacteraceae bacterium]|nr:flagellar basal body P-ring formation chaperone FlgA [Caulobacteraceae bacterium]
MTRPALRRLVGFLLTLGASLVLARAALAGTPVSLKADIADADGQVTLGELFDGAGSARDVVVATRSGPSVVLDAGAVQAAAWRAGLDWTNPNGIRRIIVRGGVAQAAAHNVEVLTYARSLAAGEIVGPGDVIWSKAAAAPGDAPRDADTVIGMAARRPLREGAAVAQHDVAPPVVIKAGDTISVVYADGGVRLTLQAKAMAAAAVGDTLNVQNPLSKKVIEAICTGPGEAAVGPEAQRLRAGRPASQYALR